MSILVNYTRITQKLCRVTSTAFVMLRAALARGTKLCHRVTSVGMTTTITVSSLYRLNDNPVML